MNKIIGNDVQDRTKLCQPLMHNFNAQFTEFERDFESDMMSYETVLSWIKKYLTGTESV